MPYREPKYYKNQGISRYHYWHDIMISLFILSQ